MSALGNFRGERLNPDDVGVFRLSNGRGFQCRPRLQLTFEGTPKARISNDLT